MLFIGALLETVCCLLVLDSVTSRPQWIRRNTLATHWLLSVIPVVALHLCRGTHRPSFRRKNRGVFWRRQRLAPRITAEMWKEGPVEIACLPSQTV